MGVLQIIPISKLDSATFDNFLKQQNLFKDVQSIIDLSGIDLISPAGLVQLVVACDYLKQKKKSPVIVIPDTEVIRSYVARSGFIAAIEGIASIEPEFSYTKKQLYGSRRGSNPMLLEVTKIESYSDLPTLLNQIILVLYDRLKYEESDALDVAVAVSECCQNMFDHNKSTFGFIAMQTYGENSQRFIEIGIADCGDGLATTLKRNPKNLLITSDIEAIGAAIKLGVSEYDDPTRGTGLHHLLEIAYKNRGFIQIRSGSAKVRFRMDNRTQREFNVPYLTGVQITLKLPAKTKTTA